MNSTHVCLRCSRRLLRLNGQLRSSSFVSLGQLIGNDDNNAAPQENTRAGNGESTRIRVSRRSEKRKSFAQQYRESRQPSGVDKVLEELFSSKYEPTQPPQRSRYSRTPKEQVIEPVTHENSIGYRLLGLVQSLRLGTTSIEDAWATCKDLLGQKSWIPPLSRGLEETRNKTEDNAFKDILLAICSKGRLTTDDGIVTPASVIELYKKHGVMGYWWHKVFWCQLAQILRLRYESIPGEESNQEMGTLMKETLEVWNIFMQSFAAVPKNNSLDRNSQTAPRRDPKAPLTRMYTRFLSFLPNHPTASYVPGMAAAAVITLDCMEAQKMDTVSYLSRFFRHVKGNGKLDRSTAARCLAYAKVPAATIEKALGPWENSQEEDFLRLTVRRSYRSEPMPKPTEDFGWGKDNFHVRMADINACARKLDPEAAMELWANFERYLKITKEKDQETTDSFFAGFLRTFWTLRRSDHAITVWNYMINSGNMPNNLHWTAMLTGCVRAKDPKSLQEIWTNMIQAGTKPDIYTWTTYITGLIWGNKWQEGLSALEALGQTWKKPADDQHTDKQADGLLIPTMAPVHAALSALIDIQRPEHNPKIIAWAESQGLRLETYTFNILLKPLVRAGNQEHIASHLAQMQAHNCPLDIVTFTIILNGIVSNPTSTFHSLSPAEQETTTTAMLAEMESHSIPANPHTYTTLLNGLLGKTDPKKAAKTTVNIHAARTILAHMAKRNIQPSSHVYTILITHYFSLSPPDLPAIDSLVASMRPSHTSHALDPIFYDRLIENYAEIDEYEKALSYLRKVPEEGKSPGWIALYKLLLALGRAGEWDLCAQLIADAEDVNGFFRHGEGSWRGKSAFWDEVDRLRARGVIDSGQD